MALIKELASNNRLWGAERIRGELLKLGLHVCKRTIQKYMRFLCALHEARRTEVEYLSYIRMLEQIWACQLPQSPTSFLDRYSQLLPHRTHVTARSST